MTTLMSVEDAQAAVIARVGPLDIVEAPVGHCDGLVLAEPVHAAWDLPRGPVSIMDGYAVRAADIASDRARRRTVELRRVTESAAGHPAQVRIDADQAARISTGALLPEGADAVIAQEETRVEDDRVLVDLDRTGPVSPGRYIRAQGSDLRRGDEVLRGGTRLRAGDLAAAASSGHDRLRVHRRPSVAIVGTGDELVPIGITPAPGQVVSSNGIMLAAQVREAGGEPIEVGDVGDDEVRLATALHRAMQADVLVTSGGISVGEHDLVHGSLLRRGFETVFRGVALRPGKPTTVMAAGEQLAFALPGNPASSLVAFELFVRPALRRLLGIRGDVRRPIVDVELSAPAPGSGARAHYVRARRQGDRAWPLPSQLSGNLRSIADFDLLLRIPPGTRELPAGARCEALMVDPWSNEREPSS